MSVKCFCLLLAFLLFCSHDMFLKLDDYFLLPNQDVTLKLFNGAFDRSENTIDRNRMVDVRVVTPKGNLEPRVEQWSEHGDETHLSIRTGRAGTYVGGVSTKARSIDLAAADFNDYLQHDGILDVLEQRKKSNRLNDDAKELYAKHVKSIFQVGDTRTDGFKEALHFPIEFIPLTNPYTHKVGDEISFILLRDGMPLADQLVYVGQSHKDDHTHEDGHTHDHRTHETTIRTNENGLCSFVFDKPGAWYVRTIHMVEHDDPEIQYESCWGTLTFALP